MNYTQKQKGSLYLTVVLVGILIAISIGVVGIVVSGTNLVKGLGDSVRAFHIADSGIEQTLYELRKTEQNPENIACSDDFNGYGVSECNVSITYLGEDKIIKAIGAYNGSQRRIEADY
jgi:hypothetical protein